MPRILTRVTLLLCCLPLLAIAESHSQQSDTETATTTMGEEAAQVVEVLDEPLYTPFIERYMLDELKQLRTDLGSQRAEIIQQILDREHKSVDRAVSYATDTITYFFYLF